jgi:hypothetical protein
MTSASGGTQRCATPCEQTEAAPTRYPQMVLPILPGNCRPYFFAELVIAQKPSYSNDYNDIAVEMKSFFLNYFGMQNFKAGATSRSFLTPLRI